MTNRSHSPRISFFQTKLNHREKLEGWESTCITWLNETRVYSNFMTSQTTKQLQYRVIFVVEFSLRVFKGILSSQRFKAENNLDIILAEYSRLCIKFKRFIKRVREVVDQLFVAIVRGMHHVGVTLSFHLQTLIGMNQSKPNSMTTTVVVQDNSWIVWLMYVRIQPIYSVSAITWI